MWRIESRLQSSVGSSLQLVRKQFVVRIEMEGDARGGGLQRFGINMSDDGEDRVLVRRFLKAIATRSKEIFDTRSPRAWRKLGIQHLIDFFQACVGGVTLAPATGTDEPQQKDEERQRQKCRETSGQPREVAPTNYFARHLLHNLKAGLFDDRIGEHLFCDVLNLFHCFVAG